jgi:hypothetical protein
MKLGAAGKDQRKIVTAGPIVFFSGRKVRVVPFYAVIPPLFSRVQTWGQVAIEAGIAKQQRIVEPVRPGEFTTPRSRTPRELVGV